VQQQNAPAIVRTAGAACEDEPAGLDLEPVDRPDRFHSRWRRAA
jgi:hypothetical protein